MTLTVVEPYNMILIMTITALDPNGIKTEGS